MPILKFDVLKQRFEDSITKFDLMKFKSAKKLPIVLLNETLFSSKKALKKTNFYNTVSQSTPGV